VCDNFVASEDRDGIPQLGGGNVARATHDVNNGLRSLHSRPIRNLEVGLEAVTGSEHDGPEHHIRRIDESAYGVRRGKRELFEEVEARIAMVCGEAQEHLLMLDACRFPKLTLC
jgi:hypothetical protein